MRRQRDAGNDLTQCGPDLALMPQVDSSVVLGETMIVGG
jgi:hypothetical protein